MCMARDTDPKKSNAYNCNIGYVPFIFLYNKYKFSVNSVFFIVGIKQNDSSTTSLSIKRSQDHRPFLYPPHLFKSIKTSL